METYQLRLLWLSWIRWRLSSRWTMLSSCEDGKIISNALTVSLLCAFVFRLWWHRSWRKVSWVEYWESSSTAWQETRAPSSCSTASLHKELSFSRCRSDSFFLSAMCIFFNDETKSVCSSQRCCLKRTQNFVQTCVCVCSVTAAAAWALSEVTPLPLFIYSWDRTLRLEM